MRNTTCKAIIELFDVSAKSDSEFTSQSKQPFINLKNLDYDNPIETPKFATFENDFFLLDGSFSLFSENPNSNDFGYWSKDISDSIGKLDDVFIERIFSEPHSCAGITFHFDKYSFPTKIQIEAVDNQGTTFNKIFDVNDYEYFANLKLDNFIRIKIIFLEAKPYRYIKLNGLDFGIKLTYDSIQKTKLKSAKLVEEIDTSSNTLSVNTSEMTVIDYDDTFSIINPKSYYSLLQKRQKVRIYEIIDGETYQMAVHYMNTWTQNKNNIATFKLQDIIGVMSNTQFDGGVYSNISCKNIIDEIMNSFGFNDYLIDDDISEIQLSGIIQPCSHRQALQQVMISVGACADTSRIDGILFYIPSNATSTFIGADRKLYKSGHKVVQSELVSDVNVTSHSYSLNEKVEKVFEDNLMSGSYKVRLKEPSINLVGVNCEITSASPFYANINVINDGKVTINGNKYIDSTSIYSKVMDNLPSNTPRNTKSLTKALLVSSNNAKKVASNLFNYYQFRLKHDFQIIAKDERVGNYHAVQLNNAVVGVRIERMEFDLSGGFLAKCEGIGFALQIPNDDYMPELFASSEIGVI